MSDVPKMQSSSVGTLTLFSLWASALILVIAVVCTWFIDRRHNGTDKSTLTGESTPPIADTIRSEVPPHPGEGSLRPYERREYPFTSPPEGPHLVTSPPDDGPPMRTLSGEDIFAGQVAAHEAAIRRHRMDRVDATWAAHAEAAVKTTLGAVAEAKGFSLKGVECRTNSCIADLEWSSVSSARLTSGQLMISAIDDMTCTRELILPSSGNPGQSVSAQLVLSECQRAPNGNSAER
jgi:hypothetical protein